MVDAPPTLNAIEEQRARELASELREEEDIRQKKEKSIRERKNKRERELALFFFKELNIFYNIYLDFVLF